MQCSQLQFWHHLSPCEALSVIMSTQKRLCRKIYLIAVNGDYTHIPQPCLNLGSFVIDGIKYVDYRTKLFALWSVCHTYFRDISDISSIFFPVLVYVPKYVTTAAKATNRGTSRNLKVEQGKKWEVFSNDESMNRVWPVTAIARNTHSP